MPGQKPNPGNDVEVRPVYCMTCSRVYLSRARRPVCSKCRSKKVIEYAKMGDKSEVNSLRTVIGNICEALKIFEQRQDELYKSQKMISLSYQSIKENRESIPQLKSNKKPEKSKPHPKSTFDSRKPSVQTGFSSSIAKKIRRERK
ncbi:MAG: hypothetical protein ACM3UU_05860 [Ignavibacteriales bacterium]